MDMTRYQTPEETESEYIALMGEDLGKVFHELEREVAWLHTKWGEYLELFGTKPSRIELVNKAAPLFFGVIQDVLWEDVILHIARLTDEPRTFDKENLTIKMLPEYIDDPQLNASLYKLIKSSKKAVKFCRDWRNRLYAHRDLQLAVESGANQLKPASRKKVKDALTSIVNVLNAVTIHYQDSETSFDIPTGSGGAVSLLYVIDDGLRADAERTERINKGNYNKNDFIARDI